MVDKWDDNNKEPSLTAYIAKINIDRGSTVFFTYGHQRVYKQHL